MYVWKDADAYTEAQGLVYRQGTVSTSGSGNISWKQQDFGIKLSGTDANSYNPAIAVTKSSSTKLYHLVWEQRASLTSSIKYLRMTAGVNDNLIFSSVFTASSGSSYDRNFMPSVTSMLQGGYDTPKILWVGYRSIAIDKKDINKEQALTETKAVFRDYHHGSFSPFFIFGNNDVVSVSINIASISSYVISWSSYNQVNYQNYYVRNTSFSNIKDFLTSGKQFQINNGADFSSVYANSFSFRI